MVKEVRINGIDLTYNTGLDDFTVSTDWVGFDLHWLYTRKAEDIKKLNEIERARRPATVEIKTQFLSYRLEGVLKYSWDTLLQNSNRLNNFALTIKTKND